ncbi:MAG: ADP-ribosylation factor-like protein, partial [Pseudomonadota bacterium]|nr:ADP-ribosylation factor-like protein [Pseudomonadota bacterium]
VPGQVYYNSTRKAVLTGVDGVIFVADSQISMEQENLESLNNLIENLKYYNRDVSQIPLILQYNKRDLDNAMSIEELDKLLNQRQVSSFPASAVTGGGVLQTLTACCKQVLNDLKRKSRQTEQAVSNKPKPDISSAGPEIKSKVAEPKPENEPPKVNIPLICAQPDQPKIEPHTTTDKPFKPEVAQIGKARLIDPYTVTLPLRLSTDADQHKLLSVDITFSINDFQ